MIALSEAQSSLLTRVLGRMKSMNMKPTAFNLSLALRANDMPPEDLGQVREWLGAHQDVEPEPEDPRGKKFTTKPETAVSDPGVDESKKGAEKKMQTTQPQNAQTSMDNGQWEKYVPEDIPRIPTWGPDLPGQPGTIVESEGRQFYLGAKLEGGIVRDELVQTKNSPEPGRVLTVKTVMGDIAFWPNAMARKGLDGLGIGIGDTVMVVYVGKRKSVANPTRSYKAYEVYKMRKPQQAAPQAQADPGQDWIEQQRAAAEKTGGR